MSAYHYTQLPCSQTLRQLSAKAFDLSAANALTPERIRQFQASACGFTLLYGTQRVDGETMRALQELAGQSEAVEKFRSLMAGAVMNRIDGHESEQRQVLHSASRAVFDDLPAHFDTGGAQEAIISAREALQKLADFLGRVDSASLRNETGEPFTDLVNIGIGGSDLGPRALYLALRPDGIPGRRVHFISNVDPDDAAGVLGSLDLSRTLINVVSKSGTTLETLTNETLARRAFERVGLRPEKHFLCVTGKGSPLDNPAKYLDSFYMFDYIGGRYSATSMVGGVCLGFGLGMETFRQILRGAREMDLASASTDLAGNLPLLSALLGIWNRNFLGHQTLAVLPYSQGLIRFAAHLQQLDMESNGKRITTAGLPVDFETGPIVWGEPGTNGQHAFYQLIHQSETVVPCEFIGFRQSQFGEDVTVQDTSSQQKLLANLLAQSLGLASGQKNDNPNKVFPGNRPNSVLIADKLTPYSLGALLAYYENKVTYQGLIWNINSFDQEGVQLGKVLADRLIAHFAAGNAGSAKAVGDDPVGLALLETAGVL